MMPQLLRKHRNHLLLTRRSQPIPIQINRARTNRISPRRPRQHRAVHHLDRRQPRMIPRRPLADQGRELRWFPIQPQGLPGCNAQGAIGCPVGEHHPPVLQQGWEAKASNAHMSY